MANWARKLAALSAMLVVAGLAGCSDDAAGADAAVDCDAAAIDCKVTAPTECADPSPVYADVAPIIEDRCLGCHYGMEDGPWPLVTFEHVAAWNMEIRGAMLDCTMPPADSCMPPMTTEEREQILMWLRCGFPES